MIRGDDEGWSFEIINDDTPLDLTGHRLDLWIKPDKKGEAIKLSSETGEVSTEGHIIHVVLSHEKTENVIWESAQWDLQCINPQGRVRTLVGGGFTLIKDITGRI